MVKPQDLRRTLPVLGAPIDVLTREIAIRRISGWANAGESCYVCICNVHSVVTTTQYLAFRAAIVNADMATPDGAPVAWMLRRQGALDQSRISGPDLMLDYCNHAAQTGESIYLLGSTEGTLFALQRMLLERWPTLRIVGAESPPFRAISPDEDKATVNRINRSGAGTVWVSFGCPKQELWMAAHRGYVRAVMLGVGAAFDFHAGITSRAPAWMQKYGLEWLHRLASDPRRLWKRYLLTNTVFILGVARELLSRRR